MDVSKTACCKLAIQICLDESSVRTAFFVKRVHMSAQDLAAGLVVFFFVQISQDLVVFAELGTVTARECE